MQKYTEVSEDSKMLESLSLLLDNDKTVLSCSAGEIFPIENVQVGQLCYRTDEEKLYQTTDGENWIEIVNSLADQVIGGLKVFTKQLSVTDDTPSTSKETGALTVVGGVGISGDVNANQFVGDVQGNVTGNLKGDATGDLKGNADTATKLKEQQVINVGGTEKLFDGSKPVVWTLDEILPTAQAGQILKSNGESWVLEADQNTTYATMSEEDAVAGEAEDGLLVSSKVLKSAIQKLAPTPTSITGNAGTATKLQTVRKLSVGNATKEFDGSADASWTVEEVLPAATENQILKHDGKSWTVAQDQNTTYESMSSEEATSGVGDVAKLIAPTTLKLSIESLTPKYQVFETDKDGLVPARKGAETVKFLREDGTWVTPNNTTYKAMTEEEAVAGEAKDSRVLTATVLKSAIQKLAPTPTSITGNAGSATKLQTPRKINNVEFDATKDIEIDTKDSSKLPLAGGTLTGAITLPSLGSSWIDGASGKSAAIKFQASTAESWHAWGQQLTKNGNAFAVGVIKDTFCISYAAKENIDTANNKTSQIVTVSTAGLTVAGSFTASGNVTAFSDARLKENVSNIKDALSKVKKLNGVTFKRKDTLDRQAGLLAQEVKAVLPEAVHQVEADDTVKDIIGDEEVLSVSYGSLMGLIVEAVKELESKLNKQTGLINKQAKLIESLTGKS